MKFDFTVIGGGILGLATARALLEHARDLRVLVLEKEPALASHQTGHNSGVIHQGIYYKPNSLKAELCVRGARQMVEYCERHDIPYRRVGKVIVATSEEELSRLEMLYERARANNVPNVSKLTQGELNEIEPNAAGLAALNSPNTSIVDYKRVADAMRVDIESMGGTIRTNARVSAIQPHASESTILTRNGEFQTRVVVNCAGLHSDSIARMCGLNPDVRIIPFRGEYFYLKPASQSLVRGLIYPVADPRLPFLGVHFTRTIHGTVEAGPNAVFAFSREGYGWARISPTETTRTLAFPGFWRMARRWWKTGAYEFYRSLSKPAFVQSLKTLVPAIRNSDLERGGAGVRAQAVNVRGELLDDFAFAESEHALHVLNAPSPAATASLALGEHIATRAQTIL